MSQSQPDVQDSDQTGLAPTLTLNPQQGAERRRTAKTGIHATKTHVSYMCLCGAIQKQGYEPQEETHGKGTGGGGGGGAHMLTLYNKH